MLEGFKKFIMRGNVVDLAVGVVIGSAFGSLVQSLVKDLISPLISLVGGQPNFSGFQLSIGNAVFGVGNLVDSLLSFLIISGVIYFFIVLPMNKLMSVGKKEEKGEEVKTCPYCLGTIPKKAVKCRFCTSTVAKS